MSTTRTVGISDIGIYVPKPYINLDTIVTKRESLDPVMGRKLRRSIDITGQHRMHFPEAYEDNAVLAAKAAFQLLCRLPQSAWSFIRHLAAGTETTVDFSKPLTAYMQGILQLIGVILPRSLGSFQVQHACAGGTFALISTAALALASPIPTESALVVCSDIARYDAPSTAEITQGAGAVSLLVEKSPKLMTLDIDIMGYDSRDVDDFFRPLHSVTAKVKGSYSMKCYYEAQDAAFRDYCEKMSQSGADVLNGIDYFVFHVPFARMAEYAMKNLLSAHLSSNEAEIEAFMQKRGFYESLSANAAVGNIYTGAIYLSLANLLQQQYRIHGNAIVGKKVLMNSYGSGNTMVVMTGTICPEAPSVIAKWDVDTQAAGGREASFEEYLQWMDRTYLPGNFNPGELAGASGPFLKSIREDGYREYGVI